MLFVLQATMSSRLRLRISQLRRAEKPEPTATLRTTGSLVPKSVSSQGRGTDKQRTEGAKKVAARP